YNFAVLSNAPQGRRIEARAMRRRAPSIFSYGSILTVNSLHQHKRAEFRRGLRSGHRQTQQPAVVYAGQDRMAIKIPSHADLKAISVAKRARDIHFDSFLQIPVVDDNSRASRFVLIWQRRDLQTSGTTGRSPYQMAVSIIPGMA